MYPNEAATAEISAQAARLRWQCRRGMLELDLLLSRFLETGFAALDAAGRADFVRLLGYQDQILHDWLMGQAVPADAAMRRLVGQIRAAMRDDAPGCAGGSAS
ncbi:MAG: succinate dehydrogenase assembly factor 2 [Gammaproteobacteria bacterium]|jgi:antitoxin CptB|nr:succinate dehydrogenase assembly factor 2 [Gammaproteobacteria bacterium]